MTSQDIFKAIISDDNVALLESVNTVLYEKSNMLLEDIRVLVAQNIIGEAGNYGSDKVYGSADDKLNAERKRMNDHNAELDKLHYDTKKRMRENPESTHAYKEAKKIKETDRQSELSNQSPEDRSNNVRNILRNSKNKPTDTPQAQERMNRLSAKTYDFDTAQRNAGQQNPKKVNADHLKSAQNHRNDSRSSINL